MTNDTHMNHAGTSVRNAARSEAKSKRTHNNHAVQEADFRGRFLNIQPGDELVFENKGLDRDSTDLIQLTNITNSYVAFKVKTTAPEKFRVKPSFGCIEAGGSQTVEISIQQGFLLTAQRDKFLVMSACLESPPKSHNELLDYWHELLRDEVTAETVEEHRLRCSIITHSPDLLDVDAGDSRSESSTASPVIPPAVLDKLDVISTKVDRLIALQQIENDAPMYKKQWNVIALAAFLLIVYFGILALKGLLDRVATEGFG